MSRNSSEDTRSGADIAVVNRSLVVQTSTPGSDTSLCAGHGQNNRVSNVSTHVQVRNRTVCRVATSARLEIDSKFKIVTRPRRSCPQQIRARLVGRTREATIRGSVAATGRPKQPERRIWSLETRRVGCRQNAGQKKVLGADVVRATRAPLVRS